MKTDKKEINTEMAKDRMEEWDIRWGPFSRVLKLKLQYFGHLMRRVDSLEKTLMLGGIGAGGEGDDRG